MIKSEEKQIIKKGQFECAFCHADHCIIENIHQDVPLQVDIYLKKKI